MEDQNDQQQVAYRWYDANDFMASWSQMYLRGEVHYRPDGLIEVTPVSLAWN